MPLTKRAIRKLKLGLVDELKIAMGLRPGWLVTILSESISNESRKKRTSFSGIHSIGTPKMFWASEIMLDRVFKRKLFNVAFKVNTQKKKKYISTGGVINKND